MRTVQGALLELELELGRTVQEAILELELELVRTVQGALLELELEPGSSAKAGPKHFSPENSCRLVPGGRRGQGGMSWGGRRGGKRGRLPPASGGEAGPSPQGWPAQQSRRGKVKIRHSSVENC